MQSRIALSHEAGQKLPLPQDAIALQLTHGAVSTLAGRVLLDAVPSAAFVNAELADHGALVLGLKSASGALSFLDTTIGQVGSSLTWLHAHLLT